MAERRDLYAVLGVARDATPEELKRAYRRLAFACHPDRFGDDSALVAKFRELQEAYEVLSDPQARQRYDEGGVVRFGASATVAIARDMFRQLVRDHLRVARGTSEAPHT